ncbi:MAG: hypothetical protein CMJ34_10445 [Phycisphaerae bacterium]|nr:hypothetical protein [Phycisphaerae bacterium]
MKKSRTSKAPGVAPLSSEEKRDLTGLGILAGAWTLVPAGVGFLLLAYLGDASEFYTGMIESRGLWIAVGLYALLFGITAGSGLLPTYAQAILGGWAFGAVAGTIGAMVGILVGTTLGHLVSGLISGPRVEAIIERRPRVVAIRDALVDAGLFKSAGIVALLRLSPNSPFALTNLVLGGSRTSLASTLIGTAAGMLPRTALAVGMASAAAADGSRDLVEVVQERGLPVTVIGLLVLVISIAVIAAIGKAALRKAVPGAVEAQSSEPESTDSRES